MDQAHGVYSDAVTSYQLATDDAEMLLMATKQQDEGVLSLVPILPYPESKEIGNVEEKSKDCTFMPDSPYVEPGGPAVAGFASDDDLTSGAALFL